MNAREELLNVFAKQEEDYTYKLLCKEELAQAILDAGFVKLENLSLKQVIDWWFKIYPEDIFVSEPVEIIGIRGLMRKIRKKMEKPIRVKS